MEGAKASNPGDEKPPVAPPDKAVWRKFFRIRIQEKLILSFVTMGLVPMVASLYVGGQITSLRIEQDMRNWLRVGKDTIDRRIKTYEEAATRVCREMADSPELKDALSRGDDATIQTLCREQEERSGLEYVQCQPPLAPEARRELQKGWLLGDPLPTIMLMESSDTGSSALMAGCRIEVVAEGVVMAEVVAGNQLGVGFAQEMGRLTGAQIIPFRVTPNDDDQIPDIPGVEAPKELWEQLYRADSPRFANVTFHDNPYLVLFLPLQGRSGKTLGLIFVGLLRSYTFGNILVSHDYDFFLLCLCLDLIVGALMGILIARSISKPIRKLARGVQAVASGNLDQQILVRTRDEIQDLATNFNSMSQQLMKMRQMEEQMRVQDRLAALGELSAGVAHEIRNPLGIIRGSAELLQRKLPQDDPRRELVDFIRSEVDRLNNVVTDFLSFARPAPVRLVPSDVNAALEKTVAMLEPGWVGQGIRVIRQYDPTLPPTPVDPEKMHQVFLNLLLNAADAMEEGGDIAVRTSRIPQTNEVKIEFQDEGKGITAEDQERIFNPFFTTKPSGTGLGLSIVQRIMEGHGARIDVTSVRGRGACFILTLKAPPQ